MSTCSFRQGFFLTRGCSRPGTNFCSRCTAALCPSHSQYFGGDVLCLTCFRSAHSESNGGPERDPTDPYALRDKYYENPAHAPQNYDSDIFDDTDFSAFDSSRDTNFDHDEDPAKTSFGDS